MSLRLRTIITALMLGWLLIVVWGPYQSTAQILEPPPERCTERECPAATPTAPGRATPLPQGGAVQQPTATTNPDQATPTISVTPTPLESVPAPSGACAANVPPATEGSQAWMINPTPPARSTTTTCVRLIVNGQVVSGASVLAEVFYPSAEATYQGITDANGVSGITIDTGSDSQGSQITVIATVTYNGQSYSSETSFVIQ